MLRDKVFRIFAHMKKLLIVLVFAFITSFVKAQNADGYSYKNDTLTFIFDESVYNEHAVKNVVVTGSFCNWSQDMTDKKWQLSIEKNGIWTKKIYNPNFDMIKTNTSFKFRVNDGKWLDPPANASNADGGNLIFMKGIEPPAISATLLSDEQIEITLKGMKKDDNFTASTRDFILTDARGNIIPIAELKFDINATSKPENKLNTTIVIMAKPKTAIDKRRVYYIEMPSLKQKTLVTYDGWFKNLKSDKELGANVSSDAKQTVFRLFAPRATALKLYVYKGKDDAISYDTIDMKMDEQGVWEAFVEGDLHGTWYDYTVHGSTDPGNSFYETHPVHISDPYARVSDDSFGKCMVAHKTIPASPLKNGRPKMENVMAYEVHVQDFTDLLPLSNDLKGTIPGMYQTGLKNSLGKKIGFDYLCELGINTVHIMPIQEMLHWPKDEWKTAFANDKYMQEQGVADENYDWGYRTSHSFAVETRYRQKGTKPGDERTQFRDLVQAYHDKGIAVIVDFVFNHTAENMDGRNYLFHFNAIDKQYYYRTKDLEHIGAYGNETKSENRYMTQRWIIDQCKHFINEFGIDGFRIDLAGQTDKQTLLKLKEELPKDIIIYGEPWIDSNDPEYNKNPEWHWYKQDAPICYFNDDTRNTYKGPVFELTDKKKHRGWSGGDWSLRKDVMKALSCTFPTQKHINSGINYLDIHDNFALADQFGKFDFDGRFGVDENRYKIAAALLFTTPGPIVLHGGSEIMRSKGLAPLLEVEKEIPSGKLYFHGKRDTYNVRNANHFIWENVGKSALVKDKKPLTPYTNSDFNGMLNYWKGLMELRKQILFSIPSYKFDAGLMPKDNIQFIESNKPSLLAYIINKQVLVMMNSGDKADKFEPKLLPSGDWKLIGDIKEINLSGLTKKIDFKKAMPAQSLYIFIKK